MAFEMALAIQFLSLRLVALRLKFHVTFLGRSDLSFDNNLTKVLIRNCAQFNCRDHKTISSVRQFLTSFNGDPDAEKKWAESVQHFAD